jgi:hypothetical protein
MKNSGFISPPSAQAGMLEMATERAQKPTGENIEPSRFVILDVLFPLQCKQCHKVTKSR